MQELHCSCDDRGVSVCVRRRLFILDSTPSHPGTTAPQCPFGNRRCVQPPKGERVDVTAMLVGSHCNRGGIYHQVPWHDTDRLYPTPCCTHLFSLYCPSAGWMLILPRKLLQYVFLGNSMSPEHCKTIWCL